MDREKRLGLRFIVELAATMVLYVAILYLRKTLLSVSANPAWHDAVLIAPAIPVWMVFWVLVRHYRRLDEYLRLELLQIVAVCSGIAACVTSSYPFARDAFGLPPMSIEYAWNVMAVCWIAAALIVQIRNRRSVTCTTP